jgi:DTW domain-containing protein YfiP
MLSAIWKLAMTHRSIYLPDLPAVSHVRRYALRDDKGGKQICRAQRASIVTGPEAFIASLSRRVRRSEKPATQDVEHVIHAVSSRLT